MNYKKLSNTWLGLDMTEQYTNHKPLWFVHIPKTGGSLIESMFANYKVGRYFDKWDKYEFIGGYSGGSYHHKLPSHYKGLDFSNMLVFTNIRDPINKILSEYIWQHNARGKELININTWIVKNLKNHKKNNKIYDSHFEPQIKYITDYYGNEIPYKNMIICDEDNFVKNINNFVKRNKIQLVIDYQTSLRNVDKNHSNRTNYDDLYAQLKPETIQLIKDYYKDDFILLEKVKQYYKKHGW